MANDEFQVIPVDSFNARDVGFVFRSVYGDDFPVKDVYEPDILAREIAAGRVTAFLAFDRRDQPAGYVSLFKSAPNPRLWEAGNMVVHPAYKFNNLSSLLAKLYFSPTVLENTDCDGIFGEAVCHHYASQVGSVKSGMRDCAIELDQMSGSSFKEHPEMATRRVSCMFNFLENSEPTKAVYIPSEYYETVHNLAQPLRPRTFLLADADLPLTGSTVKQDTYYAAAQTWKIAVWEIGADWQPFIDELLTEASNRQVISLQITLNTALPFLGAAVNIMRDRGFFLGGLLPRWFGSDGLLMQKVLGAEPDYARTKLYSKTAKDLFAFIRADREAVSR